MWESSQLNGQLEYLFTLLILDSWTMRSLSKLVRWYACHGNWSLCDNFDSPPKSLAMVLVNFVWHLLLIKHCKCGALMYEML